MMPDKAKWSQKSSIILREKGRESLLQFNVEQALDAAVMRPKAAIGVILRRPVETATQSGVRQAKLAKDKEMEVLYGERFSQPPRPRVMRGYS